MSKGSEHTAVPGRATDPGGAAGRLEAIWIKRAHGGVMDPRDRARLVAGKGIVDNADQGGWRQVTIIDRERWQKVTAALGVAVDPSARRANLMVSGIDLAESRGKTLSIGGTRIRIVNETAPCNRMDEAQPGLQEALRPNWGGGAFGYVVAEGEIVVGDEVRWTESEEQA